MRTSEENRGLCQRASDTAPGGCQVPGRGKQGLEERYGWGDWDHHLGSERRRGVTSRHLRSIFLLYCVRHVGLKQMHFGARDRSITKGAENTAVGTCSMTPALWGLQRARPPACCSHGLPHILGTVSVGMGKKEDAADRWFHPHL